MSNRHNYDMSASGVIYPNGQRAFAITIDSITCYIDAREIIENPKAVWVKLLDAGLPLSRGRRRALLSVIDDVHEFVEVDLASRIGWNGKFFALPNGEVFAPDGIDPPRAVFDLVPDRCHEAGLHDDWLSTVAEPLSGHAIAEFAMCIPFAGPMRALTRRTENLGFEFYGAGGTGKSTLWSCQCSTIGGGLGGEGGCFGQSFAATSAGLESEMRNYSDLFMSIDEGNLFGMGLSLAARSKAMMQLLMSLGRGQEKKRHNTPAQTFRFSLTYIANESSRDIIGGANSAVVTDAAFDRAIGISLEGRPFGIFSFMPPGYNDPADCVASIIAGLDANHGSAMRIAIQQMVNERHRDEEGTLRTIEAKVERFRTLACIEPNNGSARRVADAFGYVVAAGLFAQHVGALPASYNVEASALECYRIYCSAGNRHSQAVRQIEELAQNDDLVDLDINSLKSIPDDELANAPGFLKTNRAGVRELLVHPQSIASTVTDWAQNRRHFEVKRLMHRGGEKHIGLYREVRSGQRDRMVCFVLAQLQSKPPIPDPSPRSIATTRPARRP